MKLFQLSYIICFFTIKISFAAVSLNQSNDLNFSTTSETTANDALKLFNEGRHAKAIEQATPLANAGNANAQFLLGFAYETGRGVEQSLDKAISFYQQANQLGQKDATLRLAVILVSSNDETKRGEGRKILENLSIKDPAIAGRILGQLYLQGDATNKPSADQAITWWEKASEAGDIESILALARLYDGAAKFEDKKNPIKALNLYRKAILLGDKTAVLAVGSRLLNGSEEIRNEQEGREILAEALENEQFEAYLALGDFEEKVKKNTKDALLNYEKGGEKKQVDCALRSADFYLLGRDGIEKNETKGMAWLEKAAATGSPIGHYGYASRLLQVPEPDNRKSEEKIAIARKSYDHLLSAAIGGIPQAQNEIGLLYLSGAMGVADPSAAAGWFQRAAQEGAPIAMNNLAILYEKGRGVVQNLPQAGQLYEAAARNGNPQAATSVARMLDSGIGAKKNIPLAWAWAMIAIDQGDEQAKLILGEISAIASAQELEEGKKNLVILKTEMGGKPKPLIKPIEKEIPKEQSTETKGKKTK
jgi:uncharacterized protein